MYKLGLTNEFKRLKITQPEYNSSLYDYSGTIPSDLETYRLNNYKFMKDKQEITDETKINEMIADIKNFHNKTVKHDKWCGENNAGSILRIVREDPKYMCEVRQNLSGSTIETIISQVKE